MTINETIRHQLQHRSIRFFKDQSVDEKDRDQILQVAQRTATNTGMQSASVIRVSDRDLKQEVMKVTGQDYVGRAPELWVFIVDLHRNLTIAQEKGSQVKQVGMTHFFQGASDVYLMAQNVMTAAESLGLGACFVANILKDPERMVDLLQLPQHTFPLLAIIFGHPDDDPQLKPRLDMSLRLSDNHYPIDVSYLDQIKDYDEAMTTYVDTRTPGQASAPFSDQVKANIESMPASQDSLLRAIKKQGFDLGLLE